MTAASSAPDRIDPVAGQWQRVSPRYVWVDLVRTLVRGVLFAAFGTLPWLLGERWMPLLGIPAAILLITIIVLCFTPRRVHAIGYQLRTDDLVVRRGIMRLRIVSVPYGRMQLVDVTQGPIGRLVGLSEVRLVTAAAGSRVEIPGIPQLDADDLRDRLVELAESRRVGL